MRVIFMNVGADTWPYTILPLAVIKVVFAECSLAAPMPRAVPKFSIVPPSVCENLYEKLN